MDCYVCGTPRPEGAKYCPGCGRYCADDPNVQKIIAIPEEDILTDDPISTDTDSVPDTTVAEVSVEPDIPSVPEPSAEDSGRRRKKHRPVLIPVLIMVVLFTVGTIAWFAMPYAPRPSGDSAETTQPSLMDPTTPTDRVPPADRIPEETHTPTDADCFLIENGSVRLIPGRYDGNPILVIPSEINGQTVTAIADEGFRGLENVTTLVLPDTLKTIGESAFADCLLLRGVFIPDSVTTISSKAFAGCLELESVSIPVGTTAIGTDAFDGCASLLFIFYEGTFEQWCALYNEYVNPYTCACCTDGEYYHGAITP